MATSDSAPTPWLDAMGRPVPTDRDIKDLLDTYLSFFQQLNGTLLEGRLTIGDRSVWFQRAPAREVPPPIAYEDPPAGIAPRMQYRLRSGEFEWEVVLSIDSSIINRKEDLLRNAPGSAGYSPAHQGQFTSDKVRDYDIYLDRLYETPADAMKVLHDWLHVLCAGLV